MGALGRHLLLVGVLFAASSGTAAGQIISPGELARAHEDLAGISNCTKCHQLRQRGIVNDRCLSCHVPLAERIEGDRGLHATTADQNCASCHKDHAGARADIVRFDTAGFDHDDVGFELVDAHRGAACTQCHTPTLIEDRDVRRLKAAGGTLHRTFLGLGRSCGSCHFRDDPHAAQFPATSCTDCHSQSEWPDVRSFDHQTSAYPLSGLHVDVSCASCHTPDATLQGALEGGPTATVRYRGLEHEGCADCHTDPHDGALGASCATCHDTGGWLRVARSTFERSFDHRVTGFTLSGAHRAADCASCHDESTPGPGLSIEFRPGGRAVGFPRPGIERGCLSCHEDQHDGELEGSVAGADCAACHTDQGWLPSSYDVFDHEDSRFPLVQAHRAVRCASCHDSGPESARLAFVTRDAGCESCHRDDDPHDGQFEDRICASCHTPAAGFAVQSFDHSSARFTLDGAHERVDCRNCHVPETDGGRDVRYRPLASRCRDCHTGAGKYEAESRDR